MFDPMLVGVNLSRGCAAAERGLRESPLRVLRGRDMQKTETADFVLHAVIALVSLLILNLLIPLFTPLFIKEIQYSYWIFFYHFPAAINCYIFFVVVALCSVLYLASGDPIWDQRARAAGEVGLLACTITISTGSTWARMAWNQWWIWDDARLISAAVMWLI